MMRKKLVTCTSTKKIGDIITNSQLNMDSDREVTDIKTENLYEPDYLTTDMLDDIIGNKIDMNDCEMSERYTENKSATDTDKVPFVGVNLKKETNTTCNMKLNRIKTEQVKTENYDKCNLMTEVVEHIKKEDGEVMVKIEEAQLKAYVDKKEPYDDMDSIQLTEELDIKVDNNASTEKTSSPVSISGVTFEALPKSPNLSQKWCPALEKCGIFRHEYLLYHFLSEDFYVSPAGRRKLRKGAVPSRIPACRAAEKESRKMSHRSTASMLLSCYNCECTTYRKDSLIEHMKIHAKHVDCTCENCEETFNRIASTETLIIADQNYSQLLYKCRNCAYETSVKIELTKHFLEKHTDTSAARKPSSCLHCDAIYKTEAELYDHIIKKHPSFIGSIPRKIHQCTYCSFRTTRSSVFTKHVLIHLGSAPASRHKTCPHCNRVYQRKVSLDNHIMIRHPDFISSVTSKIYECTKCTYKTTVRNDLTRHAPVHEKTSRTSEFRFLCSYCNKKYKTTKSRDNHIVTEHPDFITSITSKVHECRYCEYKSVFKKNVSSHKCKATGEKTQTC